MLIRAKSLKFWAFLKFGVGFEILKFGTDFCARNSWARNFKIWLFDGFLRGKRGLREFGVCGLKFKIWRVLKFGFLRFGALNS